MCILCKWLCFCVLYCCCSCSVAQWYLGLCNPMDCSTPDFRVLHYLPKFAQTHAHWVDDAIQPSILWCPLLLWPSIFPASGTFPLSQFFISGGQNIGVSASASVLPMNNQGWFSLGLTGLIPLLSMGLSRVLSSTRVQKHQIFGT